MVKVFKTNVTSMIDANLIIQSLINIYPKCKINFDLDDCDKILRIEGGEIDNDHIVCLLNEAKFECKEIYDWQEKVEGQPIEQIFSGHSNQEEKASFVLWLKKWTLVCQDLKLIKRCLKK